MLHDKLWKSTLVIEYQYLFSLWQYVDIIPCETEKHHEGPYHGVKLWKVGTHLQ